MKSFASGMRAYLAGKPKLTAKEKRILRVLDLPDGNRRKERCLAHWKATVDTELRSEGLTGRIDYGAIDWAAIFEKLLPILLAILAKFIGL